MSRPFEEAPKAASDAQEPRPTGTRWLSRPLEDWMAGRLAASAPGPAVVDVLVVGSGYGGAAAAQALAGRRDEAGRRLDRQVAPA